MSLNVAIIDPDIISKAEFARRRRVKPPRVSQWIAAGQISGPAIVGEGRFAQIRESVAVQQLKRSLDTMQMTGNGLTTNLTVAPQPKEAGALQLDEPTVSPTAPIPTDTIEDEIKRLRRDSLARQERDALRDQAIRNGRLTEAEEASKQAAKNTVQLMATFETKLGEFATAISTAFKVPQRDVEHLLRGEFRKMRADVAADFISRAEILPEKVEVEIEHQDESDV